jgi:hypothetical protein
VHVVGFVQQAPLTQVCAGDGAQHVLPHSCICGGHSHAQVVALKTCPGPQLTQIPVLGHVYVPGGHSQFAVDGLQKPLQHSEFCRQPCPPWKQRPMAEAFPGLTSVMKPPAAVTPNSFNA